MTQAFNKAQIMGYFSNSLKDKELKKLVQSVSIFVRFLSEDYFCDFFLFLLIAPGLDRACTIQSTIQPG